MHLVQSYDLPATLWKAASLGGAGVHVFILCSGFGLYLSYLNRPLRYVDFLKRRFLKVYIPYILIILISTFIPFYNTSADKWIEVLSHVFLYKMFFEDLECSFGAQMWFMSTIIQFYLFWPVIVKLFESKGSLVKAIIISLLWATFTIIAGIEEKRIWNSFFLQYLWEFVLGMWLAKKYNECPENIKISDTKILFFVCIVNFVLYGVMGYMGGVFKMYNDIPSLFVYGTLCLLIYRFAPQVISRFFIKTNRFSYEWYLTHILIFACCRYFLNDCPLWIEIPTLLMCSYFVAMLYNRLLIKVRLK